MDPQDPQVEPSMLATSEMQQQIAVLLNALARHAAPPADHDKPKDLPDPKQFDAQKHLLSRVNLRLINAIQQQGLLVVPDPKYPFGVMAKPFTGGVELAMPTLTALYERLLHVDVTTGGSKPEQLGSVRSSPGSLNSCSELKYGVEDLPSSLNHCDLTYCNSPESELDDEDLDEVDLEELRRLEDNVTRQRDALIKAYEELEEAGERRRRKTPRDLPREDEPVEELEDSSEQGHTQRFMVTLKVPQLAEYHAHKNGLLEQEDVRSSLGDPSWVPFGGSLALRHGCSSSQPSSPEHSSEHSSPEHTSPENSSLEPPSPKPSLSGSFSLESPPDAPGDDTGVEQTREPAVLSTTEPGKENTGLYGGNVRHKLRCGQEQQLYEWAADEGFSPSRVEVQELIHLTGWTRPQIYGWFNKMQVSRPEESAGPLAAVTILRKWVQNNHGNLSPNPDELRDLVRQTKLTLMGVDGWFATKRRKAAEASKPLAG